MTSRERSIGFAITTLRDWLKRFAPLFHPIRSKTKTNCVKFIKVIQFKQMLLTAVFVLFLLKLKWPKSKNFHETIHERYGHDTLKTVQRYERDLLRYNKVALDITFLQKCRLLRHVINLNQ